jgi:hypothetical protein
VTPSEPATALHSGVDAVAAALHALVDVAAGVTAESGTLSSAQADPRLADAEHRAAVAMGRLDDLLHERLGISVDVGAIAWEGIGDDGDADGEPDADAVDLVDDFWLHFVVAAPPGASPEALDRVIEIVDMAGRDVATRLEDNDFVVAMYEASRGDPDLDGDDVGDEGDADEGDSDPGDLGYPGGRVRGIDEDDEGGP